MSKEPDQNRPIDTIFDDFIQAEAVKRGMDPKALTKEELRLLAIDLLQDLSSEIQGGKNKFIQLLQEPAQ